MPSARLGLVLALTSSLTVLACRSTTPPPEVIVVGAATPATTRPITPPLPGTADPDPAPRARVASVVGSSGPLRPRDGVRDPRSQRLRPTALLVTELSGLENLFENTPRNAPDRVPLARRLAEDYVELSHVARPDLASRAVGRAIRYYGILRTDYPTYPLSDEVRYFLGYEYEMAGDAANARLLYYELITKYPASRFVPYAYFGFGALFLGEAETDPSSLPLALQSFQKVLSYPRGELGKEALMRVASIQERQGDTTAAESTRRALERDYPTPKL